MAQDPKSFIRDWIAENINAEAYQAGDTTRARDLAQQCRQDAMVDGITAQELDLAAEDMVGGGDSLETLISDAMEDATDKAVQDAAERGS